MILPYLTCSHDNGRQGHRGDDQHSLLLHISTIVAWAFPKRSEPACLGFHCELSLSSPKFTVHAGLLDPC